MKIIAGAFCLAILAVGCGAKKNPNDQTYSYAGAGSRWSWELRADGTFTAQEATESLTVEGTFERLSTGFVKLVVTSATGTNPPPAGAEAVGLEVPGVVFLVKPVGSNEPHVISMVAAGVCPTSTFDANWIHTQFETGADMTDPARDSFGTFHWDQGSSTATLPSRYALQGYTALGSNDTPMTGTCADGVLSITSDGGPVTIYLTAQQGAVVKIPDGKGVLAMPTTSISSASALAGSYAGLLFNAGSQGDDRIRAMKAEVNADGTQLVADGLLDIESGSVDPNIHGDVSIDSVNAPSNGFLEATLTGSGGGGTGKLACMAATDVLGSGKNIFFCVGQAPSENQQAFNALFVSTGH